MNNDFYQLVLATTKRRENADKQTKSEEKIETKENGSEPKQICDESKEEKIEMKKGKSEKEKKEEIGSELQQEKKKKKTKKTIKKNANEKRPPNSKRYDQCNHFPLRSKESVRCKNEGCGKKTDIYCKKCNVHLCLMNRRNCFTNFHLLNSSSAVKEEGKCIETRPKPSIRFDERNHFPIVTASLTRCKNCQKKTYIKCQKCMVHLCSVSDRNCFTDFHVLSIDKVKIE